MRPEQLRRVHDLRDAAMRMIEDTHMSPAEAIAGLSNALGMTIAWSYPEGEERVVIASIHDHLPRYVAGYRERMSPPRKEP